MPQKRYVEPWKVCEWQISLKISVSKASIVNDRFVKFSCFCGYLIKFTDKHIRWNDFEAYAKFCMVLIDSFLFVFMAAFKDCPICFCPHWLLWQLEDTEKEMGACCPGAGETKGQDTQTPDGPARGRRQHWRATTHF